MAKTCEEYVVSKLEQNEEQIDGLCKRVFELERDLTRAKEKNNSLMIVAKMFYFGLYDDILNCMHISFDMEHAPADLILDFKKASAIVSSMNFQEGKENA